MKPTQQVLFSVVSRAKRVNPKALTGQRSGLVAGSWQANPRDTLRGDRSVRCCGGQDEEGPRGK